MVIKTLPNKSERRKFVKRAINQKAQQELERKQKETEKEREANKAFTALCNEHYDRALQQIAQWVEDGETQAHIQFMDEFCYRFDKEGKRTFNKFRERIIRRINRNFPDYSATSSRCYYTASNMTACYETGAEYREWEEFNESILVTWEN